ncbi:MAG: hypothetical protein KKA73_13525 [Chloroflexi bacterium]|nr:hypothetical protein [Chloroflexota bacterium]MBU1748702.1 hypothetical protein [Chloroflexota bacterium]MBU1877644.1 hypothetical protein [Chloroflexota bacterium]
MEQQPRSGIPKGLLIAFVVFAFLIVLGLALWVVFAVTTYPVGGLANLRDIAIVVLALESILVMFIMLVIVILLWDLLAVIQRDLIPLLQSTLESAEETAHTVQGTTTFVSAYFVAPLIRLASTITGIQATVAALGRRFFGRD